MPGDGCTGAWDPSPSPRHAYLPGRWLHSLNGDYHGSTFGWQLAVLGRGSIQDAVDQINRTPQESRRILVLASLAKAHDPKAWWAHSSQPVSSSHNTCRTGPTENVGRSVGVAVQLLLEQGDLLGQPLALVLEATDLQ